MLFFKKNENTEIKSIDIHSHILPSVDDGSSGMDVSLAMARIAVDNGITDIVCTPHNKMGMQNESREFISVAVSKLQSYLYSNGVKVKLHVGNEVMAPRSMWMDHRFVTMNDTDYVLIEFDPYDSFDKMVTFLTNVQRNGYKPIVAHVERYECLVDDYKLVYELKDMDCLIQVNSNSVIKKENRKIYSFVHKLLSKELVDFIATDAHDDVYRKPNIRQCAELLYSKYNKDYIDEILYNKAREYLNINDGD